MPKYGKGLNREIYLAVKAGEIGDTFNTKDVEKYAIKRGWVIPDTYINVCLANAAAEKHSLTYKKYFRSIGDGVYTISPDYSD